LVRITLRDYLTRTLQASGDYILGLRQYIYSCRPQHHDLKKLDRLSQNEWPGREQALKFLNCTKNTMRMIVKYQCELCGREWDQEADCQACETSRPPKPTLMIPNRRYRNKHYPNRTAILAFVQLDQDVMGVPGHMWYGAFDGLIKDVDHYADWQRPQGNYWFMEITDDNDWEEVNGQ
jgi:hypothetical protein